jgi:hypothetical protein
MVFPYEDRIICIGNSRRQGAIHVTLALTAEHARKRFSGNFLRLGCAFVVFPYEDRIIRIGN